MELTQIKKDPLAFLMYCERYVNQRDYSRFCNDSEVSEKYQPKKGNKSFVISATDIFNEAIYSNNSKNQKFLFVHPDSKYAFREKRKFIAIPTSSTRTIFIKNFFGKPIFIKTSISKRISRFKRELDSKSIRHSIKISKELDIFCKNKKNFGYLKETTGIIKDNFGCIYREVSATPKKENAYIIPLFSLYSIDEKNPKDPLLIEQIAKYTNIQIETLINWIFLNMVSFWCSALKERGLILEMHSQNTLLELNEKLRPSRIIVRDFCSAGVDPIIRQKNKLNNNFEKRLIGINSNFNRALEYSLVYDYLLTHHSLDEFLQKCSRFNIDFEAIRKNCIEIFQSILPIEILNLFPDNSFGYIDQVFDNIPVLKEIQIRKFRPEKIIQNLKGGKRKCKL